MAEYSEDQEYRYFLEIVWDVKKDTLTAICLNPSKATEEQDDPTIRRLKAFAREFDCGGVRILNAFALRSTDPKKLFTHKDPIGPENTLEFLKFNCSPLTIAAWGGNIQAKRWNHFYRGHDISAAMPDLKCLRITDKGHPEHPLYLPGDLKPIPFSYKES
jgi:hypothetical protein